MESNKSKENRRGKNRKKNSKIEEKYKLECSNDTKSEKLSYCSVVSAEESMDIVTDETSSDLQGFENKDENNTMPLPLSPMLRRQLQTHKNILRLLHEHKLFSTQINGQRILSIQPIQWNSSTPGIECEIFVGRIPKTIYEDTLYPLFKYVGEIFQIRLMVDMAELTRGYCFIMYTNQQDAARAIAQLDQYEISPGKKIRVLASVNKCKLYVGPLPWNIDSKDVVKVIYESAWDIECVCIYRFSNQDAAYAIVSFKSHRNAALARRKLRPEKLFKCNEVHVEWARDEWNPSNVYEDRGTVNDKGDVKITRKYLESKKTVSPFSTPNNNNSCWKQQFNPLDKNSKNTNYSKILRNNTRYSTMLTMSAALNDSSQFDSHDKKLKVDINDNVQLPDNNVLKDKIQWTNSADTDDYPNFDMWNSGLAPQLSNSFINHSGSQGTNSDNKKNCKLPDKTLDSVRNELLCDWKNNAKHSKTLSLNGQKFPGDIKSDYCCSCSFNETVNHNRSFVADIAQNRSSYQRNHPITPCYILLRSPNLNSKDMMTYMQPAIVNHVENDQTGASSFANYDHQSYCNKQLGYSGSISTQSYCVEKPDDSKFHRMSNFNDKYFDNAHSLGYPTNLPSNYWIRPHASNVGSIIGSNLAHNSTLNVVSENTSRFVSISAVDKNDCKRPRPILKRLINGSIQ